MYSLSRIDLGCSLFLHIITWGLWIVIICACIPCDLTLLIGEPPVYHILLLIGIWTVDEDWVIRLEAAEVALSLGFVWVKMLSVCARIHLLHHLIEVIVHRRGLHRVIYVGRRPAADSKCVLEFAWPLLLKSLRVLILFKSCFIVRT